VKVGITAAQNDADAQLGPDEMLELPADGTLFWREGRACQPECTRMMMMRRIIMRRMRPKLHLPVFGHAFPRDWYHGIVCHLEGCAVSHRSIRE
jgi:hypothetical protein